jgi:hypothetical protein
VEIRFLIREKGELQPGKPLHGWGDGELRLREGNFGRKTTGYLNWTNYRVNSRIVKHLDNFWGCVRFISADS